MMGLVDEKQAEREAQRAVTLHGELTEKVTQIARDEGYLDLPGGLRFFRLASTSEREHGISRPALCVVLQGRKEVMLGNDLYVEDPNQYLITAAALPIESQVTEASQERPCLGFVLDLDPALVGSVIVEAIRPSKRENVSPRAFNVSPLDADLLDALMRLLRVLDLPEDEARFLRPLVVKEIIFRLLKGEQGGWLRHTAVMGGHSQRIAGALERLRREYNQPLRIEDFAKDAEMSVSGFHAHFKAVTAMSPMQFQRGMRLREARRLMLYENFDAARAGFEVGYDDSAHFNREYKRHFGEPPRRDVQRLREVTSGPKEQTAPIGDAL